MRVVCGLYVVTTPDGQDAGVLAAQRGAAQVQAGEAAATEAQREGGGAEVSNIYYFSNFMFLIILI